MHARTPLIVMLTTLGPAAGALAQIEFVEVGDARGIGAYDAGPGWGAGISAADYDDDGDIDLFVPTGIGLPDQLYRNDGSGHFEEIARAAGVDSTLGSRTALWLDFDGDGHLDLVVGSDCYTADLSCLDGPSILFHRQERGGTFTDVTAQMNVDGRVTSVGQHRGGFVAGDLDDDGWLDLVGGLWAGRAFVLMNQGGQEFVDIAFEAGIATASFDHWQPAILDFDGDGRRDIYWAIDFTGNRLWMNKGNDQFVDKSEGLEIDNQMNDMGLALGDYDNDGDFDMYVTVITELAKHNVLYRNDSVPGAMAFTEIAGTSRVHDTGWGWGVTFFDADNDGWLDLAVTNGWFDGVGHADQSRFFHSDGGDRVRFTDRSEEVGFDDFFWGTSVIAFDMDRDGDLDLAQTCNMGGPLRLLENRPANRANGSKNHHLVVRPRMDGSNARAIGAIVHAEVTGRTLTRLISAGTGHLGQEPAEAFFGLGPADVVERLTITWPDGARTIRTDVAPDQMITIRRSPCAGTTDLDGDGAIGTSDLLLLLSAWGPCDAYPCPEDVDGDGVAGTSDLLAMLAGWGACR